MRHCKFLSKPYFVTISGWLEDVTGNWNMSFVLTGCLLLTSACVVMLEPCIKVSLKRRRTLEAVRERATLDKMPVRIRRSKSSLSLNAHKDPPAPHIEEGVDVTLTSKRISRIYRPVSEDDLLDSPDRTFAPASKRISRIYRPNSEAELLDSPDKTPAPTVDMTEVWCRENNDYITALIFI